MIFSVLMLFITFIGSIFILMRIIKGDEKSSPSTEMIIQEIKELRQDIAKKEKALIDLLQELNKE